VIVVTSRDEPTYGAVRDTPPKQPPSNLTYPFVAHRFSSSVDQLFLSKPYLAGLSVNEKDLCPLKGYISTYVEYVNTLTSQYFVLGFRCYFL
jgi:hypothetical protein